MLKIIKIYLKILENENDEDLKYISGYRHHISLKDVKHGELEYVKIMNFLSEQVHLNGTDNQK